MPGGRVGALAALVLAAALAGLALAPVTLVRVVTGEGEVLACRRVAPGDPVTLAFTHSMYGGEVRETWRVDGARLARAGIETDNAAAAEYYATDGAVARTQRGFAVIAPPLAVARLPVRIDAIGDHRLRVGGEEIALARRVDGSVAATLSVARAPWVTWVVDRDAGCGDAPA